MISTSTMTILTIPLAMTFIVTAARLEAVASRDKERVWIVGGEHGYQPDGPKAGKGDQQKQLLTAIDNWAKKRWPQ